MQQSSRHGVVRRKEFRIVYVSLFETPGVDHTSERLHFTDFGTFNKLIVFPATSVFAMLS